MFDIDQDGKVDRVVLTYDEELGPYTTGVSGWTLGAVPSGGALSAVSSSGVTLTLSLVEGTGAPDTNVGSFTLSYQGGGIQDAHGNPASTFTNRVPADKAGPVLVSVSTPPGGSGTIAGRFQVGDSISFNFSEFISTSGSSGAPVSFQRGATGNVMLDTEFGTIDLGSPNYLAAANTFVAFNASYSRMTSLVLHLDGLGGATGTATTATGTPTFTFTPNSFLSDFSGNHISAASFTQNFLAF